MMSRHSMNRWWLPAVLLALAVVHPVLAAAPPTQGYAQVLAACVKDGKVDYAAVKANVAALDAYLAAVAAVKPDTLGADAKAFYINAYNALVLREVVRLKDAGPLKSVLDHKGFFDGRKFSVAGEELTLNALEEQKLRKPYADPRIHFAVNCASASCPVLAPTPYETATLDASLDQATKAYLATPHGLRVTKDGVTLTKLMEWYQGDFGGQQGVRTFLAKHAPQAAAAAVARGPLAFHDYDWALNAR